MNSDITALLWRTFGKYRPHLAGLVVLGFLGALLEGVGINAAIPLLSFLFGNQSLPTDAISRMVAGLFAFLSVAFTFRHLIVFIVVLFLVRALAQALFGYLRGWIGADFLHQESIEGVRRTMLSSWSFLLRQKLGVVHATLVRDIQRTGDLLSALSQVIQSLTGSLIYFLIALNISPLMTLYTALGGGALLFAVRPFLSRTLRAGGELSGTEKQVSQFITEHVIGIKSIKTAGAEGDALRGGQVFLRRLRTLQIRLALMRAVGSSLFQPFMIVFVIGLFALTYKTPGFNVISFAAALYLIQKIFTYLESGQSALHVVGELIPYAANLTAFRRELTTHAERGGRGTAPFVFEDSITFKDVSFSYTSKSPVLDGVDFSVRKGTTVALIGPSGAGKTSVADLLLRLFEPSGGRMLIDGRLAGEIRLSDWRSHFGYVPQDVFLFNGSIEDNIRFYREHLSHDDITRAAQAANIHDVIQKLPDGYTSQTGDRGVMLSGGQRQRIALARALAGKPDILVLDEATSALDAESERLIQEAIKRLRGEVTVFIIAHRLSTVKSADLILVLDNGHIRESGSPEELLRNPSSYFSTHGGTTA